jgi:MYXO-CTERM domain-containing protein
VGGEAGCQPACASTDECPVGDVCANDSCMRPAGGDAGCALCDHRDGGAQAGPDAATVAPPLPKSGCGCQPTGAAAPLLPLLLLLAFRRRTR